MKKVKLPTKSMVWILFLISTICEIFGLLIVGSCQWSLCIAIYEISPWAMGFILFHFTAVFPDIVYVVGIVFLKNLGKEPLGCIYNLTIGICCLITSMVLLCTLEFCGNPTQIWILVAGLLGVIAAIVHLINFGLCHMNLPSEEKYIIKRSKCCEN